MKVCALAHRLRMGKNRANLSNLAVRIHLALLRKDKLKIGNYRT
jgi:hypothetical protein